MLNIFTLRWEALPTMGDESRRPPFPLLRREWLLLLANTVGFIGGLVLLLAGISAALGLVLVLLGTAASFLMGVSFFRRLSRWPYRPGGLPRPPRNGGGQCD